MKSYRLKRLSFFFAAAVLLILFDQWTKGLAIAFLKEREPFVIIDGILELLYVENPGAAFGILKGRKWFFCIIAALVNAAILYLMYRLPAQKKYRPLVLSAAFVSAGAVGNVIDRIRYSFVVDFIYFKPIDFPVFNVADIYITCSCAVLFFLFCFYYKDEDFLFLSGKK